MFSKQSKLCYSPLQAPRLLLLLPRSWALLQTQLGSGCLLCHTSKPKCAALCTATHTRLWAPNLPFLTSCDGAGDQQKVIGWKKGHWQVLDHHTDFSELFKAQPTLWPSGLQGESNGLFQLCHSALPGHFSWAGRGTVPL